MLKETETEETIGFFVTFLSLVAFQLEGGVPHSLATPMVSIIRPRLLRVQSREDTNVSLVCFNQPAASITLRW